MPERSPRRVTRMSRTPRASRLMIAVLQAVGACDDLIHHWDAAQRADGVVVRATSRAQYDTAAAAGEAARTLRAQLSPAGHVVQEVCVGERAEGPDEDGWRAFVEILVCEVA